MRKNLYITKSGTLSRKDNTLLFKNEVIRKVIPIVGIENIYLLGECTVNSKLLSYLSESKITCHFFNYYGYYTGSYYPKETYLSGKLLVKQVEHYTDTEKRVILAKKFISGMAMNMVGVLEPYYRHNKISSKTITFIKKLVKKLDTVNDIQRCMQIEGEIWNLFYAKVSKILIKNFDFSTRVKRPPDNPVNALISFGNSLLYSKVTSKMYHTQLNPTVSYLHEPGQMRFSLSLDVSEIFKPSVVFHTIFNLVNKKMIQDKHFVKDLNYCMLNEDGRRVFVEAFERKLLETKEHPVLKRKFSNEGFIKLELYKLIKHILEEKEYSPYSLKVGY